MEEAIKARAGLCERRHGAATASPMTAPLFTTFRSVGICTFMGDYPDAKGTCAGRRARFFLNSQKERLQRRRPKARRLLADDPSPADAALSGRRYGLSGQYGVPHRRSHGYARNLARPDAALSDFKGGAGGNTFERMLAEDARNDLYCLRGRRMQCLRNLRVSY